MNFESVVNDVKTRVEDVSNRAQGVAELSLETVKKANDIVVPTFQGIFERQTSAARELVESGKSSVSKVRSDGLKAVVANPIEYVPAGRDTVLGAFNATIELTTKAGTDLAEVLRKAFDDAIAQLNGNKPVVKAAKKQVRTAARKTSTAARKTAGKTKSAASKATKSVKA